jgi:RNA polymerase sigma-70 factor (ECF subfamily)
MEENELIKQAQSGSHEAFTTIMKKYEQKVFHLAYGFVQDRAAADDLAQEVFIKAYFSLPKFRFQSEFGTWFYRVAVNHIKDYLRKTARHREVSLEDVEEGKLAVEDKIPAREKIQADEQRKKMVFQVLETLPQKYRMILTLRDVRGLPYEEIGRVLAISAGTVDSRLHRARKMLRKKMMPFIGQEGGGL